MVKLKRIYAQPEKVDGKRVLVDRLWPRGVKRKMQGSISGSRTLRLVMT